MCSRECDDSFQLGDTGFSGPVICSLKTLGTKVKIRPGDTIAQAHIIYDHMMPVTDEMMQKLLSSGELKIIKDGKSITDLIQTYVVNDELVLGKSLDGQRMNGGFTLTHDPVIKVCTGLLIDPKKPDPACFEQVTLPTEGYCVPLGKFFLSSSVEVVSVPSRFVGWVNEWNHLLMTSGYKGPFIHEYERASSLQTHASAPKIDPYPRFSDKITFENIALSDFVVKAYSRLADLNLFYLHTPIDGSERSRYLGQTEATNSKCNL